MSIPHRPGFNPGLNRSPPARPGADRGVPMRKGSRSRRLIQATRELSGPVHAVKLGQSGTGDSSSGRTPDSESGNPGSESWIASQSAIRRLAGKHVAPSSSGPGHRPLKAEIAGSNPAGATRINGVGQPRGWPIRLSEPDNLETSLLVVPAKSDAQSRGTHLRNRRGGFQTHPSRPRNSQLARPCGRIVSH